MGEVKVIVAIRMIKNDGAITLTQTRYIEKVLNKFNHLECAPVSRPMDYALKLFLNVRSPVSQLKYSRVIGCLT